MVRSNRTRLAQHQPPSFPRRRRAASASILLTLISAAATLAGTDRCAAIDVTASAPATRPVPVTSSELVATELVRVAGQSDAKTRREAATTILRTRTAEGVKSLATLLATENNSAAKLAVCEAVVLVKPQAPEFVPALQQLLGSEDVDLRKAAAAALETYTDPKVIAHLDAYRREQQWSLTQAHLKKLMDALYEETTDETKRIAWLGEWLKSELAIERFKALDIIHEALRRKGTKPTAEVLEVIRGMGRDSDEVVRQKVVMVLRDLGLLEDVPLIRAMLRQEDAPAVREEIYKALGKLADPDSIDDCVAGLHDTSEYVAAAAADALGRLCERGKGRASLKLSTVVEAIGARIRQPIAAPQLRVDLFEAMSDIADPKFGSILVDSLQPADPEAAIRQAAVRGLGRIGDRAYLRLIIDTLGTDTNAGVREVAAEALGALGDQPNLLDILRSRMDLKNESSAAVQSRAWQAYQQVFQRLQPADQEVALASWSGTDAKELGRRVELLTKLETQTGTRAADARRLAQVRDQLGDALFASNQIEEAAAAWTRATVVLPAVQLADHSRIVAKMIDGCFKNAAPDPVITLAGKARIPEIRRLIAGRLLEYLQQLSREDRQAAAALLDKLTQAVPDRFGSEWSARFEALRLAPSDGASSGSPSGGTSPPATSATPGSR
ncbi:MAG: HEAT repeat domain-containing protein [Phycisphaerae bacterium]|nr:HEAT repeat domain-containing protein [Phycisphaerae bacterium]